jgi:putative transposase
VKQPLVQPVSINITWSLDFVHDSLEYGRKIRVLNIIADFSREALDVEPDYSQGGERVVAVLEELIWSRGKPLTLRTDNGIEFIRKCLTEWCKERNIEMKYIQPGQPMQNAYIVRLNHLFREEALDAYVFDDLKQLKMLAKEWRTDYNLNHTHYSLGGLSPKNYLKKLSVSLFT